jgi:mannose-6-phosphate isomerase-like protein (cupin superfamily)
MNREELMHSWQEHVAPSGACSPMTMQERVARWGEIPASPRAFVDTYIDGHQRTLYSVIGSGVTDDPSFKPKIRAAENFHIDFIVAPAGCGAAMHFHDSEEVFVVQSGRWEVDWIDGATGLVHTVTLGPKDTISVPPFVHRAFRSLDGDDPQNGGLLISILGGKIPGRVKWHEGVAQQAQAIGAGFNPDGSATRLHDAEGGGFR